MNHQKTIDQLVHNRAVFSALLNGVDRETYLYRPHPQHWCLLEIIAHLRDEEAEDFKVRMRMALENSTAPLPSFDPLAWVSERRYMELNYETVLQQFLAERQNSIEWLHSLPLADNTANAHWQNFITHPRYGAQTAQFFLANWLAHDYLHIRQINRIKYHYLQKDSNQLLAYAGNW
ncbi:MAG: DinB family protein [Bacteroidota bacterium]